MGNVRIPKIMRPKWITPITLNLQTLEFIINASLKHHKGADNATPNTTEDLLTVLFFIFEFPWLYCSKKSHGNCSFEGDVVMILPFSMDIMQVADFSLSYSPHQLQFALPLIVHQHLLVIATSHNHLLKQRNEPAVMKDRLQNNNWKDHIEE